MQCDAKSAACKMHIAMRKIEHATQHAAHSMLHTACCTQHAAKYPMQCSPPTAYCVGASVKLIALRPGSRRCSARRRAEMSLTATQRSAAAVDDDQTISPHEGIVRRVASCMLHVMRCMPRVARICLRCGCMLQVACGALSQAGCMVHFRILRAVRTGCVHTLHDRCDVGTHGYSRVLRHSWKPRARLRHARVTLTSFGTKEVA